MTVFVEYTRTIFTYIVITQERTHQIRKWHSIDGYDAGLVNISVTSLLVSDIPISIFSCSTSYVGSLRAIRPLCNNIITKTLKSIQLDSSIAFCLLFTRDVR